MGIKLVYNVVMDTWAALESGFACVAFAAWLCAGLWMGWATLSGGRSTSRDRALLALTLILACCVVVSGAWGVWTSIALLGDGSAIGMMRLAWPAFVACASAAAVGIAAWINDKHDPSDD